MFDKKFVLCVDGVCVRDGKMLLLKRSVEPFKGCWGLVGGHVDDDETVKDALKREFLEETSLQVDVEELIGGRLEETPDRVKIILTYKVTNPRGEVCLNWESQEFGWFSKTPSNAVYDYDRFLQKIVH